MACLELPARASTRVRRLMVRAFGCSPRDVGSIPSEPYVGLFAALDVDVRSRPDRPWDIAHMLRRVGRLPARAGPCQALSLSDRCESRHSYWASLQKVLLSFCAVFQSPCSMYE